MKKPKFLFKIDSNTRGKVYINKKWQKDVVSIDIHGEPNNYSITMEQYKRKDGHFQVENNEIVTEKNTYHIGVNKQCQV